MASLVASGIIGATVAMVVWVLVAASRVDGALDPSPLLLVALVGFGVGAAWRVWRRQRHESAPVTVSKTYRQCPSDCARNHPDQLPA